MNQPRQVGQNNNSSQSNPNNSQNNLDNISNKKPKTTLKCCFMLFMVLLLIVIGFFVFQLIDKNSAKSEAKLPLQDNNSLIKNIESTTKGERGYFCDGKNTLIYLKGIYLKESKLYKKDLNSNTDSLIYQQLPSVTEFGSKLQFAVSPNCDQIILSDGKLNTDLILIDLDGNIIKKSRIVTYPNMKYSMATMSNAHFIKGLSWNNGENKITIIYNKVDKSYLGILEFNAWNTERTGDNDYNYDILESNIIQIEHGLSFSGEKYDTVSFDPENDSKIYLVYNDGQKNILTTASYKEQSPKLKNVISFGTKTSSIDILSLNWMSAKECWVGTSDKIYKIQNIENNPQVFETNWHSKEEDINGRKLTRYKSIQIVGNKFLSTRYVQIYNVAFSSAVPILEKNELFLSNINEVNVQWNEAIKN